jgi:hypothetical protein
MGDHALDERGREPVASVVRDSLSNLLLPPALAAAASAAEPARFSALVDAVAAEWAAAAGDAGRVEASLKWVSLVNWCASLILFSQLFLLTKALVLGRALSQPPES